MTLAQFRFRGIHLSLKPDGHILARGPLNDDARRLIRENREALVTELQGAERTAASERIKTQWLADLADIQRGPGARDFESWTAACRAAWARQMRQLALDGNFWSEVPAQVFLLEKIIRTGNEATV